MKYFILYSIETMGTFDINNGFDCLLYHTCKTTATMQTRKCLIARFALP